MGGKFVEAFVSGFTEGGTGIASGLVGFFDGLMKGPEGALTSIAEVSAVAAGLALVVGIGAGLFKRAARKVTR